MTDNIKNNIEIAAGFYDHPNVIALCAMLGKHAFIYIIFIWLWLGRHGIKDGVFPQIITDSDIEMIAKWDGAPGVFVDALIHTGWLWLDGDIECYVINGIDSASLEKFISI